VGADQAHPVPGIEPLLRVPGRSHSRRIGRCRGSNNVACLGRRAEAKKHPSARENVVLFTTSVEVMGLEPLRIFEIVELEHSSHSEPLDQVGSTSFLPE
jgi:hypothetical protein